MIKSELNENHNEKFCVAFKSNKDNKRVELAFALS